jgi:hypothetical protein
MYSEANVRILSWRYMSYLSTLFLLFRTRNSAECFMQFLHSIPAKAVFFGSMAWSALTKRNGTVLVHFVRPLDYDRP